MQRLQRAWTSRAMLHLMLELSATWSHSGHPREGDTTAGLGGTEEVLNFIRNRSTGNGAFYSELIVPLFFAPLHVRILFG